MGAAAVGLIYLSTSRQVRVVVDGDPIQIRTHARTVGGVLADARIAFDEADKVWPEIGDPVNEDHPIRVDHARDVSIHADGESIAIRSPATIPENLLQEAGILIFPGDLIFVNETLWQPGANAPGVVPLQIEIHRGHNLTVLDDGRTIEIRSAAPTLGEALWENWIRLREGDVVTPPSDTPLENITDVTIARARAVAIDVEGGRLQLWASGDTVREALAAANVPLQNLDYTIPDLSDDMPEDGNIRVVRVQEQVLNELAPVPFETVYQPVEDLEIDQLQVMDPGTFGVLSNRIRIRLEDGEEVERVVEGAVTAVEPEPRQIGYGTKIVIRTLDTPGGTIEYWRAVPVYATSYSPCNLGVSWCGSTTASGVKVSRGVIGVIRSWYNAMKKWPVYVPNYGRGSIEDIGAGIAGRDWIDLGFSDEDFERWHSWTTLYFLTPVPLPEHITWILP
jgi:uncharacterized protein YabE (DUF348 family)